MGRLPFIVTLRYDNPTDDFAPYAPLHDSFFLDSSMSTPGQGRFSFWGYNPKIKFSSRGGFVTLQGHTTIGSPYLALKDLYQKIVNLPMDPYLPFSGGLVGFLGYEWGAALENIPAVTNGDSISTPDCRFGLYDTIVSYDYLEGTCWVSSWGLDENLECDEDLAKERAEKLAEHLEAMRRIKSYSSDIGHRTSNNPEFRSSFNKESYIRAVGRVMDYLRAGDCYQVNLSQRFMAAAPFSPWEQYLRLRKNSPAPYSSFLQCESFQILSTSPECFLHAKADGEMVTRPIKGTRKRGENPIEDLKLRNELLNSPKDNAELLMITDLERNDFGKICVPGSVEVPQLQGIETFAQVHHLLSTVKGKRRSDLDVIDCLAALSPGGSITGAPKIRSMQIIQELETCPRGVYTGAIGWIGPNNTAHFNIAIRTMILQDATAFFHAGGGIVIDSDPEAEYEETLTKAKGMFEALI
ncbi:MAG: aminodeoxychorismate synthase component I [Deltaproteobacteria bacterium]|nr:aminodeoxychorismate synthase component I [Deltaproteobacteria bacterium]